MRRVVLVLLASLCASMLVSGCGGGGGEEEAAQAERARAEQERTDQQHRADLERQVTEAKLADEHRSTAQCFVLAVGVGFLAAAMILLLGWERKKRLVLASAVRHLLAERRRRG